MLAGAAGGSSDGVVLAAGDGAACGGVVAEHGASVALVGHVVPPAVKAVIGVADGVVHVGGAAGGSRSRGRSAMCPIAVATGAVRVDAVPASSRTVGGAHVGVGASSVVVVEHGAAPALVHVGVPPAVVIA